MNITIMGSGFVGLTTGACLANLGHTVVCCDVDAGKIRKLRQGTIPFYEPGLPELVKKNTEHDRLLFTDEVKKAVGHGQVIFNCVGTPPQKDGSCDLSYIYSVADSIAEHANSAKILVNKSTVPPGTARSVTERIKRRTQHPISVVSNPEFLKEGSTIHDFNHPDRLIFGAMDGNAFETMRDVYAGIIRTYVPIVETSWETAELIKYAANCFLATKISYINEIANICDLVGGDVKTIAKALGMDYRISPRFLHAGIGYGGSCFPKDVQALVHHASQKGYESQLLKAAHEVNERQKTIILQKLYKHIPDVTGKTIAVLGLSFKPKTNDMRMAPSLKIVQELLDKGAIVRAYDPEAIAETKQHFDIYYAEDAYGAVNEADAVLLLTEWDEFRSLNLDKVKSIMSGNIILDGRNVYDPQHARNAGLVYEGIGVN